MTAEEQPIKMTPRLSWDTGSPDGDVTVFSLHHPVRRDFTVVPFPAGFPPDGKGVSIALFRGTYIIAHHAAPPHFLNCETGAWEEVGYVPAGAALVVRS